ncbi:MAG: prepilin-type N-terminal cleavage/methylation domain-containing protein [Gemmatimonadaceae bacterium]|jgi:prepilin-type N-terminal cleavage/methylation domain-containing protein|nr:prepilin-type N-terminal cleavage/methylation domain-containing protein [Gemmatimonadaceae bacterium]
MRRAFTLLEVMIALVVGGVVVLLAYATLQGGTDVQARLARAGEDEGTTAQLRTLLGDALRHALPGGGSMVVVRDARDRVDSFALVTRGVMPPHGASAAWRVALVARDGALRLQATSGEATQPPLLVLAPGAARVDVRFHGAPTEGWVREWRDSLRLPALVELRFLDDAGRETAAPLVMRTAAVAGA